MRPRTRSSIYGVQAPRTRSFPLSAIALRDVTANRIVEKETRVPQFALGHRRCSAAYRDGLCPAHWRMEGKAHAGSLAPLAGG